MTKPYSWLSAFAGLFLVLSYWVTVKPPSAHIGYFEDYCSTDFSRQIAANEIEKSGRPHFESDQVMAPFGGPIPYLSWSPERDWLGSAIWKWNPEFPFAWYFTGASWLLTYFVIGFILCRMGRILGYSAALAWFFAAIAVLFHVPRHFKTWHHWEHLNQHWIYVGFFLDAWIWCKLTRKNIWDPRIEIWRAFALVGMLMGVGTFWGPLIFEWLIVRGAIAWVFFKGRGKSQSLAPWRGGAIFFPILFSILGLWVALRWYLPIYFESRKLGDVHQPTVYFAHIKFFFRPLWLELLLKIFGFKDPLQPITTPETVVTAGSFYWIAAGLAIWRCRVAKGFRHLAPFVVLLFSAVFYASVNEPTHFFQAALQAVIPFMSYFRVASRWGLFLPQILAIIALLGWPEIASWWRAKLASPARFAWIVIGLIFVELSCAELSWLSLPVLAMPALPRDARAMMKSIHDSPGTAVLDLPFCVAGGNAVCTDEECPQYPESTISQCMRIWHGKNVYGLYAGRLSSEQCAIYRRDPYTHWFSAWREKRCFNPGEWQEFCSYLGAHSELSAVLLYPDIWGGSCLADFESHLGPAIEQATVMNRPTRGGQGAEPTRILRFASHCSRLE